MAHPDHAGDGGGAIFLDGVTARRRAVQLSFDASALTIQEGGIVAGRWPYADLRRHDASAGLLRIGCKSAIDLARLEIDDSALAAALVGRVPALASLAADRGPRSRLKIVVGSVALATSLLLTTLYLVPIAADRLVPLIPYSWEQRFSQGLNEQVQKMFSAKPCREPAGLAALARLSAQLVAAANLPVPANIAVLDSPVKNAITLPGGKVYLFNGLLQFAQEPDEIAGVLAHELGHVAGRDGLKQLIETGGSSFLLGLLFGDIAGGSTVALGGRLLVDNAHTRQSERAADATSARIMTALGRSAVTMARFLTRVTASSDSGRDIALLRSHPLSAERLATLEKLSRPATGPALLSAAEWTALKAICR